MASHEILLLVAQYMPVLWVAAFGACVGSLINVLVYRLPLGLGVVTPPSACPICETRLTWRENIPIFGWLLLGGRCRFCRSRISPEYPLVEAFTALLFASLTLLYYCVPSNAVWLGVPVGQVRPEWAQAAATQTWPLFVMLLILAGSLVAMSLVDLKTFTIPAELTTVPAIVGVFTHGAWAAYVGLPPEHARADGFWWALPTPHPITGWWWIGATFGAAAGLVGSMVLLRLGLIRRSFADFEAWERQNSPPPTEPGDAAPPAGPPGIPLSARLLGLTVAALCVPGGLMLADAMGWPRWWGTGGGLLVGPIVGGIVANFFRPRSAATAETSVADRWIMYPHARREMVKELAFLALPAVLGWAGGELAVRLSQMEPPPGTPADAIYVGGQVAPMWLVALAGSVMGYLVGGAVVWGVRILGSLLFGKEAMGMGDVHLLAAVGACLGWIDATLAFFLAAFVGLYWFFVATAWGGGARRSMPYGPYLAAATFLVIFCKPLIELGLSRLLHAQQPINLP